MILAGILQFFAFVIYAVLSPLLLLSDVTSDNSIASGIDTANGYISSVPFHNFMLSVLGSLAILTVFEAVYWGYKGIKWIYTKIPGIS